MQNVGGTLGGRPGSSGPGVVGFGQGGDLGGVVGEHAPAAPGLGAGVAVHEGAPPAPVAFQGGDTAFGSGAPFDQLAEPAAALARWGGRRWVGPAGDGHVLDAQGFRSASTLASAVAAVGGDLRGCPPEAVLTRAMAGASSGASGGLPTCTLWSTMTPSALSTTWALIAELDRLADPALRDRPGVGVVQDTTRVAPSGIPPATRSAGLGDDLFQPAERCVSSSAMAGAGLP